MRDVLTLYNERYRSEDELFPFHNFELVASDYHPKRNSFHYQIENAEHSSFLPSPSILAVTQAVPPSSAKCSRKRNQGTGALYEGK